MNYFPEFWFYSTENQKNHVFDESLITKRLDKLKRSVQSILKMLSRFSRDLGNRIKFVNREVIKEVSIRKIKLNIL